MRNTKDIVKTNWKKFSKLSDLYINARKNGDHILADKLKESLIWSLKNGVYWEITPELDKNLNP